MRNTTIVCLCIGLLAGSGCEFKGGPEVTSNPQRDVIWQPRPTSIRVYPSSRFVHQGDQPLLEARIELLDEMGDSVKAGGDFRFELYPASLASGRTAAADRLYAWDVALHTLDDQRRHYDAITRAYLFRLRLDDLGAMQQGVRLVATFTPAQGNRLQAQTQLAPAP